MNAISENKISFYPFLLIGVIAGVLLSCLITQTQTSVQHIGIFPFHSRLGFASPVYSLSFIWINFYAPMFLLAYPNKKSLFQLCWVTLIPSFFASLPFYWGGMLHTVSGFFLMLFSAYALNAFHIHYQKNGFRFNYQTLFYAVWDTFAKLLIAFFFTLFCWIILKLTSALFDFIEFQFISMLIEKKWFSTFATSVFLSIGLYIATQTDSVARNVRNILLVICRYLFIPLSVIGILFTMGLLINPQNHANSFFVYATFAMIAFLSALFLNGVYQDGSIEKPYPIVLLWILRIFIIVTPVFSGMSIYHYYFYSNNAIHINGLNTDNFPYFFNLCLLTAYNVVYAIIALCPQKQWMKAIECANVLLAFILIVSALMTAYPAFVSQFPKPINKYSFLRSAVQQSTKLDVGFSSTNLVRACHVIL